MLLYTLLHEFHSQPHSDTTAASLPRYLFPELNYLRWGEPTEEIVALLSPSIRNVTFWLSREHDMQPVFALLVAKAPLITHLTLYCSTHPPRLHYPQRPRQIGTFLMRKHIPGQ